MGNSTHIFLSNDAQINNVIDVIGILIGQKKQEEYFDNSNPSKGSHCKVENVATWVPTQDKKNEYAVYPQTGSCPSMVNIIIPKNKIDKIDHNGSWFYEGDEPGTREIIGGCSEFWQKIGTELVKFFGGWVDYDDCDGVERDVEFTKPRKTNCTKLDEDFDIMRNDMLKLQAIK
jgi:hypothetical protein